MKKERVYLIIGAAVLVVLVVLAIIPFPTSKLHLKIYFQHGEGSCKVYYTTEDNPIMNEENSLTANISDGMADIELDASLAGKITDLRFDFPTNTNEFHVMGAELTSAGWIQQSYKSYEFLAPTEIVSTNDIVSMDTSGETVIVLTAKDPYVVFGMNRVEEINDAYSHYTVIKFGVVVLAVLAFLFMKVTAGKK